MLAALRRVAFEFGAWNNEILCRRPFELAERAGFVFGLLSDRPVDDRWRGFGEPGSRATRARYRSS
jgi:hypothetical protein